MEQLSPATERETYANEELMHRKNAAIEVFLMWHRDSNVLSIFLRNGNKAMNFTVPNDRALDAFEHPYAYAAQAGMET